MSDGLKKRTLLIANWKMNGLRSDVLRLTAMLRGLVSMSVSGVVPPVEIVICPPATLLSCLWDAISSAIGDSADLSGNIFVGAQDCHTHSEGSFTGCISARMIADCGGRYVLLGHCESRRHFGDSDADVAAKSLSASAAGLRPVICVGETKTAHDSGCAIEDITVQLQAILSCCSQGNFFDVAYEPIWAIGASKAPSLGYIYSVHCAIADFFTSHNVAFSPRILYGGSVDATNASAILAVDNVDGLLLGRAGFDTEQFFGIIDRINK